MHNILTAFSALLCFAGLQARIQTNVPMVPLDKQQVFTTTATPLAPANLRAATRQSTKITADNVNNRILIDGVRYPFTWVGLSQAVKDCIAATSCVTVDASGIPSSSFPLTSTSTITLSKNMQLWLPGGSTTFLKAAFVPAFAITASVGDASIIGMGKTTTAINCTGAGRCITVTQSPWQALDWGGKIQGLQLSGNSAAGSDGIYIHDVGGFTLRDVVVGNFNGTGASCVHLDNTTFWTERTAFENSWWYNCTYLERYTVSGGTISFARTNHYNVRMNIGSHQEGIRTENDAHVYNSFIALTGNLVAPATIFHTANTSQINLGNMMMIGIEGGGTCVNADAGTSFGQDSSIFFGNNIACGFVGTGSIAGPFLNKEHFIDTVDFNIARLSGAALANSDDAGGVNWGGRVLGAQNFYTNNGVLRWTIQTGGNLIGAPGMSISAPGAASMFGNIKTPQTTITLVNGANQDVATTGSYNRVVGPTAAYNIGGFAGGTDGQIIYLFNSTAFALTISNEDAGSGAANRITTLSGTNVTLRAGMSFATFIYDGRTRRWILTSTN